MNSSHTPTPPRKKPSWIPAHSPQTQALIRRLHAWLDAKKIAISSVTATEMERFFQAPFRKLVSPPTAYLYKRLLIEYLFELYRQKRLSFHPKELGIRLKKPLPPLAEAFLRSLEPTLRPSTRQAYQTNLHHFHEWLHDARIRLRHLARPSIEQWLLSLHHQGFHPSTRIHAIQNIRSYLCYLAERGELRHPPHELLRSRDFPKLPSYLPRPLPPDIDYALQKRLDRSSHPLWQALLLMRLTGLRIGELQTLEYHCIRTDPNQNAFLKVPLGKLNNERLVPLSPKACAIIAELQRSPGNPKRPYLLEQIDGSPFRPEQLRHELHRAAEGLETPEPITPHRLRHTYATDLLNAGMSLLAIMRLLGHRDFRMTLRYTAITQETVGKEYFEALQKLEARYTAIKTHQLADPFDPIKTIADLSAWIQLHLAHELRQPRLALTLTKRLERIRILLEKHTHPPNP